MRKEGLVFFAFVLPSGLALPSSYLADDCYKPRFLCDNARKVHALNSRPCAPCCHMRMLGNEDTQTRIENPTVRLCTMRSLLDSTRRIALMAVAPPARPLSSCKSRMYELTFHRSYSPPMICLRRDKWRHPCCRSSKCSPRPLTASRSTGGCQSVTMAPIGCAAALERAIRTTVPARHRLNFRVSIRWMQRRLYVIRRGRDRSSRYVLGAGGTNTQNAPGQQL